MKFLNYNINGLLQKVDNVHLIQYRTSHDFVCLTQYFVAISFESDLFMTTVFTLPQREKNYLTKAVIRAMLLSWSESNTHR